MSKDFISLNIAIFGMPLYAEVSVYNGNKKLIERRIENTKKFLTNKLMPKDKSDAELEQEVQDFINGSN